MGKRKPFRRASWFQYIAADGFSSADPAETWPFYPCNVLALTIQQSLDLLKMLRHLFAVLVEEGIAYYDGEDREFNQWLEAGCPTNCHTTCDCLENCIVNVESLIYALLRERTTVLSDFYRDLRKKHLTKAQRTPPLNILAPTWPVLRRLEAELNLMVDWGELRSGSLDNLDKVTVAEYLDRGKIRALQKESDPQTQPPATSPKEAAALIARVAPAALVLFGKTVSPKVHSFPAGVALPDRLAEKARLRIDAWEEMREIRIRKNPFYLREIDASAWRLATRAQAVAPLLADADLDYHNLLEMARKLEKAGQVAEPTDWPGALHDFEAARPALEEGKVYYEAAARSAAAVNPAKPTASNAGGEEVILPPLTDRAAAVYELLKHLPPHRGMKGPAILEALDRQDILCDQSTLTKSIIPALEPYGVANKRGVGYYIDHTKCRKDSALNPS